LSTPLRIATRRSQLALWQAEHVAALLRAAHPALPVELVPMSTQGDRVTDRALADVGGKGLFVKELEAALRAFPDRPELHRKLAALYNTLGDARLAAVHQQLAQPKTKAP